LAISEVLGELHDRHQSEAPGGFGRLPKGRVEISKCSIRVHGAERITHLHVPVPFGKGGMSDFSSMFWYIKERCRR
jgi:hypothetical protein